MASSTYDTSTIEVPASTLPALPDDLRTNPAGARLDLQAWFTRPAPLHLEIGSGKGTFLLQEAPAHPQINWIGIEYEFEFFAFAADRLRRHQVPHVRMLCLDASDFVHWRVPSASVEVIHLYFPDPWPKTRHHKRRMIQDRFLADCARVLIPGGSLRIATDHAPYWAWMRAHFDRWTTLHQPFEELAFERPASAREGELVGSNFERKYRREPGSGGGGTDFFATTLRLRSRA